MDEKEKNTNTFFSFFFFSFFITARGYICCSDFGSKHLTSTIASIKGELYLKNDHKMRRKTEKKKTAMLI